MEDLQSIYSALENAHAAGDKQSAQQLVDYLSSMSSRSPPKNVNSGLVSPEASALAAEGMGPMDTLLVGAGRGFDKLAMGLKQGVMGAVEKFGSGPFAEAARKTNEQQRQEEAIKDSAYAGLSNKRPYLSGIGEIVPTAIGSGTAGIIAPAIKTGIIEALKYGTGQERVSQAAGGAAGALLGGSIGKKIGELISPVAENVLSGTKRAALSAAEKIGYKPRLSEVTNSPFMARMEDFAARTPGGAGIMQDFSNENAKAINRAAAGSIGENVDELTPEVFANARRSISAPFEKIKDLPGKSIKINKEIGDVADEISNIQSKRIPSARDSDLSKLTEQAKMLAKYNGAIDGETYQLIRSDLSTGAQEAKGTTKSLYGKLLNALDNAAQESLQSTDNGLLASELKLARPMYANLSNLEKGLVAEGGNVSPARLAQVLRSNNGASFREGRLDGNPLFDIAKIGESLKPLSQGSQTYDRLIAGDIPSMLMRAGPAYVAAKTATSPLMSAYPRYLLSHPGAAKLASKGASLSPAVNRALVNALAQRMMLGAMPSVPVMAENQ